MLREFKRKVRVLRTLFAAEKDPSTKQRKILRNEEIFHLYKKTHTLAKTMQRRLQWIGHVVRATQKKGNLPVFEVVPPLGKRLLCRRKRR